MYSNELIKKLLKDRNGTLARKFNNNVKYIDDVLNNEPFGRYVNVIYSTELEIKYTLYNTCSALYLYIHFRFDNTGKHNHRVCDDFNIPFLSGNIPISRPCLSRELYRTCSGYDDYLTRGQLLTSKFLVGWLVQAIRPI